LGSLEGYLFAGENVEKKYLAGWLENIEREFKDLPGDASMEIADDYATVLEKVAALFLRLYGEEDSGTLRVRAMTANLKGVH